MAYTVRPPKEKLRIVFEGMRAANISELCRREGISQFIDYYNHRRPHQSLSYVTPYDMLTGRADGIIHQRKEKHIAAQKRRKEANKRRLSTGFCAAYG
jgi:hypothetical protein